METTEQISARLRQRGYRVTPQRRTVLGILMEADDHLSASQIYLRARARLPGVTGPTIYRTLAFLERNDLAYPTFTPDGRLAYEIAARAHHHLVCRNCGREIGIDHAQLRSLYRRLEKYSGFKLTGSHLTFFGLCPDCQRGAAAREKSA
jgi:Fe2+ or Zn2+ uptake regulation protein